jgi:hypothetical protein
MGASAGSHCATGGKSSPWIEKATKNRGTREASFAVAIRNIFLPIIRSSAPRSYIKRNLCIDCACTARKELIDKGRLGKEIEL